MMGVHDIGASERSWEAECQRVGRVSAEERCRLERAHPQPLRLAVLCRPTAERQQLTVDMRSKRAGQLKRIALTAPEQTGGTERRWSDMNDTHVSRRLIDPW